MVYKPWVVERQKTECEADDIVKVRVGKVYVEARGCLTAKDTVDIDGYSPGWIDRITIILSCHDAPRIILEGPCLQETKPKT